MLSDLGHVEPIEPKAVRRRARFVSSAEDAGRRWGDFFPTWARLRTVAPPFRFRWRR
jgi:hypothetical protein